MIGQLRSEKACVSLSSASINIFSQTRNPQAWNLWCVCISFQGFESTVGSGTPCNRKFHFYYFIGNDLLVEFHNYFAF